MPPKTAQEIAKSIPPLPAAISKLQESPRLEVSEAVKIVSCDPALAARVLKLSNSTFYGRRGRVQSLNDAVVTLGVHTVRSLALGLAVAQMRQKVPLVPGLASLQLRFWRNSVATSVAASSIAKRLRLSCRDEAFTGGLVGRVGQLGMMRAYGAGYATFLAPAVVQGDDLAPREEVAFGLSHLEVGHAMCQAWNLPERLTALVGGTLASEEELGSAIRLARGLAEACGFGGLGSDVLDLSELELILRAKPPALLEVVGELSAAVSEAAETLELPAVGEPSLSGASVQIEIADPIAAQTVELIVRGLGCEVVPGAAVVLADSGRAVHGERLVFDVTQHGLQDQRLSVSRFRRALISFLAGVPS